LCEGEPRIGQEVEFKAFNSGEVQPIAIKAKDVEAEAKNLASESKDFKTWPFDQGHGFKDFITVDNYYSSSTNLFLFCRFEVCGKIEMEPIAVQSRSVRVADSVGRLYKSAVAGIDGTFCIDCKPGTYHFSVGHQ